MLSLFDAKDQRANGFVKWTMDFSNSTLELGGRGEFTSLDIDSTVSEPLAEAADELATIGIIIVTATRSRSPRTSSSSTRARTFAGTSTDRTQVRLSVARTVRRPSFDQLNPTLIIDDEESILGNPTLDQETALGARRRRRFRAGRPRCDRGLQRLLSRRHRQDRAGRRAGRRQRDLPGVRRRGHRGDGLGQQPERRQDLGRSSSTSARRCPSSAENLHVFANYTWIDSEIRDANANFPIDRPFSLQPDYIYNVGLRPPDRAIGPSPGARATRSSARPQEWVNVSAEAKEVTDVEYDGNLEFFVEKTLADSFVVRLAAQNLLDARQGRDRSACTSRSTSPRRTRRSRPSTRTRNRTRSTS